MGFYRGAGGPESHHGDTDDRTGLLVYDALLFRFCGLEATVLSWDLYGREQYAE